MSDRSDIRGDLEPGTPDELVALGEQLLHQRPVPRAAFRGDLGRHLASMPTRWRPTRLRLMIAAYAGSGAAMLVLAAAGAAGAGPLS